jgi:NAD(P)-dependent dehydrogenase (short-subunit alcohol dehydrogenase family)
MAQTVLTTGANSGIGLATAIEVAKKGFDSVGGVRSEAKARIVREAAMDAGVTVRTVILDVNNATNCRGVISDLKPYGLVNNAGFPATGAVEDIPDKEVREVLETMVVAPIRLARLALPYMRDAGEGRIVNMSSIYGITTTPLSGWYQACKHALEGVSDALRMEIASTGVKVVLIEPGGFKTGIWEQNDAALSQRKDSRYKTAYGRLSTGTQVSQPLMGNPRTVARVVVRALSNRNPNARYLVGYDAMMLALMDRVNPTAVKDRVSRLTLGL